MQHDLNECKTTLKNTEERAKKATVEATKLKDNNEIISKELSNAGEVIEALEKEYLLL